LYHRAGKRFKPPRPIGGRVIDQSPYYLFLLFLSFKVLKGQYQRRYACLPARPNEARDTLILESKNFAGECGPFALDEPSAGVIIGAFGRPPSNSCGCRPTRPAPRPLEEKA
jgi:hypothetical protein